MKRIVSLLLLAALILGLTACQAPKTPSDSDPLINETESSDIVTDADMLNENFKYKHVIIVGIDGMGAYHKNADTPNIDSIFADYALTDVAQSYRPVASGPCWLSMFTGVDPMIMRVPNNPYEGQTAVNQR